MARQGQWEILSRELSQHLGVLRIIPRHIDGCPALSRGVGALGPRAQSRLSSGVVQGACGQAKEAEGSRGCEVPYKTLWAQL